MPSPHLTADQIGQVSGLVARHITDQWGKALPLAVPLSPEQRASLDGFCLPQVSLPRIMDSTSFAPSGIPANTGAGYCSSSPSSQP